ncbi:pre-mRNA-splicing factor 38A-like [Limulus polyphemus]|uniref:Pre-mRNA-splicing factor 38 n=1 Tax=Limulus polyphemus TaxID=6850 RepID=A0ABM1BSS1_LIMPO|nr:pre-mRNA-splicing factor 38A-like [Limulus polyphemus]
MANRTVKDAQSVRGTNPQYLIEKIIRSRIYDSKFWKEECFALTAELLVDKAMELKYIGGVFGGNIKPTPFLCLVLKMLQIQPEKDIVVEFIRQEDFKYVRALGAFYMRLVGTSIDSYKYLEPLYNDYRKIRRQNRQGSYEAVYMDEFIDELLHEERICDVILPRIQKRQVLEELNELDPRVSALDDDLDDVESEEEEEEKPVQKSPTPEHYLASAQKREDDKSRRQSSPTRHKRIRSRSPHKRERSPRRRSRERTEREDRDRRRHRSRERDYHVKEKDRDYRHRSPGHEKRSHEKKSSHRSKHSRRERESKESFEIAESNVLRAKLGLAPLRR